MGSIPPWSSQPQRPSQSWSPPIQSYHGQTHSQQASDNSRGGTQSARGYLPSGRNTPNNYALTSSRPNSGQLSDRPPSIPLREQTTPTMMPAHSFQDRPSSRPDNSPGGTQAIPTISSSQYYVPRPRYRLPVWERAQQVKARAAGTALPRPSVQNPEAQANIRDKRESLPQVQRHTSRNEAATTPHGSESMKTRKRAADRPPKIVIVNKRGRHAAASPSTQSILPSQQQALAGPAMNEHLQEDFAIATEPGVRESRGVLEQLSSNIPSRRSDLRTGKGNQISSTIGQQKATPNSSFPRSSSGDELSRPDLHSETKFSPLRSAPGNSHGVTAIPPGQEPLVPHHESSTLATAPEPPQMQSDGEIRTIKAQLVQDVWKVMKPYLNSRPDMFELMAAMNELNKMTKSRLPPEDPGYMINWNTVYQVLMSVERGVMTHEALLDYLRK